MPLIPLESAEEYIARAELAERQARKARTPEERRIYEEVAQLWRGIAGRQAAHRAPGGGPASTWC